MGETVQDLIGWKVKIQALDRAGRNMISNDTQKWYIKSMKELDGLVGQLSSKGIRAIFDRDSVTAEFQSLAMGGMEELKRKFNTKRKLRQLSVCLGVQNGRHIPICLGPHFGLALELLAEGEPGRRIVGVTDALMQHWAMMDDSTRVSTGTWIQRNVDSWKTRNQRIEVLRGLSEYLVDRSGPTALAGEVLRKGELPDSPYDLVRLLGISCQGSYFGAYLRAYVLLARRKGNLLERLPGIIAALERHLGDTKRLPIAKQILAEAIGYSHDIGDLESKELLQRSSLELVGDPGVGSVAWDPWSDIEQNDANLIQRARKILNEWLAIQVIKVFFDNPLLGMDEDRKKFWLKYCKHIDYFKLYTHEDVYSSLMHDERVKPFISTRVGYITDRGTPLSALAFSIKDYVFVEFSTVGGAFYAYRKGGKHCPDLARSRARISELRKPQEMDSLFSSINKSPRKEGKFNHMGNWQMHLSSWLQRMLEI